MAALDDAISGIRKTLETGGTAAAKGPVEMAGVIVQARVNVSNQYKAILDAMKDDSRLDADPELRDEFAKRLQECRHQLARHQVKWPMLSIAEDIEAYMNETEPVSKGNRDFIAWAHEVLKANRFTAAEAPQHNPD